MGRKPFAVLAAVCAGFLAVIAFTANRLPERVATHFDALGRPDGWMSRTSHLVFISMFALLIPLLLVGISYATKFLPPSLINIPNKTHWLAPQRRDETVAFIGRYSVWLACASVLFVAGIHLLVLNANLQTPPRLSVAGILTVTGCFILATVAWVIGLLRRFRRGCAGNR